jgi:uncharacterized protein YjiS (DUF1127 family)
MFERNNSVPLSSFFQAERQARIERRLLIKASMRDTMHRFAEWLRVLCVLSIRLARDLAAKRVLRSAIRELHQLDDRMLADIGITRGEIESAVRNGLPTRLTHTGASHHARRDPPRRSRAHGDHGRARRMAGGHPRVPSRSIHRDDMVARHGAGAAAGTFAPKS